MNALAFDALCERIDRQVAKWRPFVFGTARLAVKIYSPDNLTEPIGTREASVEEAKQMAYAELVPLVNAAIQLRQS